MQHLSRRRFLKDSFRCAGLAASACVLTPSRANTVQAPAKGTEPYPFAVAIGPKGTVYIADKNLKTIYRLEEGGKLAVVYKGSAKYKTPLYNVMAMAADSAGNLFLCDTGSMDVWRMSPDGKLAPLTGEKLDKPADGADADAFDREARYAGKFDKPMGIAIDADGNAVVADLGFGGVLYRVPAAGGEPKEIARVPAPHGIALDRDGSIVVVSQAKDQLLRVSLAGEVTPIVKGRLAEKNNPQYVVVDQSGYIVSDNYAKAIWRVTAEGEVKKIVQGDPLVKPAGLALDPDGNILVADPGAKKLFRVTPEGKIRVLVSVSAEAN